MHKIAAELRHRELTQEIYNIGDEVAEYLEHLIEAIEDWDEELCMDCLAELGDIVEDARVDSGRCVGELMGLRQALVSGVRSGTISAACRRPLLQLTPPSSPQCGPTCHKPVNGFGVSRARGGGSRIKS